LPKCKDYTGVKGSHSANKKIKFWIQQRSKGPTEGTSGQGHRTVRCTPDSVRCTRGLQLKLATFGNFQRPLRYNSPDMSGASRKGGLWNSPASGINFGCFAKIHRTVRCTPDSVRCTRGLQLKLATFGNFQRPLRYNSPDCPVCTGHVRCFKEGRPLELASLGN
jgi:hypothetical protein